MSREKGRGDDGVRTEGKRKAQQHGGGQRHVTCAGCGNRWETVGESSCPECGLDDAGAE